MDWSDYASILKVALIVAVVVNAVAYFALRLLHSTRRFRRQHTWRSDCRALRWVGPIAFVLIFFPGISINWLTRDMCGSSRSQEFRAPDGKHKIVVYAFDCGATTDFSLVVSLLGGNERLPEHRIVHKLYSHYHQEPGGGNFEVSWEDSHNARVKVVGFDGKPLAWQDDVSVRFEELR